MEVRRGPEACCGWRHPSDGCSDLRSSVHAQAAEEERHNLQQRFVEAAGKSAGLESQLRQLEARWATQTASVLDWAIKIALRAHLVCIAACLRTCWGWPSIECTKSILSLRCLSWWHQTISHKTAICRKDKLAKRVSAVEAERDELRSELTEQKQQAAKQLAAARAEQEAASAELAETSKQLRAALADVQHLQGRISELETLHAQTRGALEESNKAAAAAQVGGIPVSFWPLVCCSCLAAACATEMTLHSYQGGHLGGILIL